MSKMTYKGYIARIEYDEDDEIFVGHIAGIRDRVGFHADTVPELKAAFHEAVDDYVETCKAVSKDPLKSYSGQVMFRIKPKTHRSVSLAAELSGLSLNQWAEIALAKASRQPATED